MKDYSNSKIGKAYKLFKIKDGKLYPPMVANPNNEDTPLGIWIEAKESPIVDYSVTGRPKVKSTQGGTLAYRPGWHLGDEPRAIQFDRATSWKIIDTLPEYAKLSGNVKSINTLAKKCTPSNICKYYYIKDIDKYAYIYTELYKVFLPYDFIWTECEYIMDINYQEEANEQGYMRTREDGTTYRSDKYQHSLAGLPKIPKDGYYKYRTNPNPITIPWVITGAIRVIKLLDDYEVQRISCYSIERQGGNKTLAELGLKQI